MCVGCSPDDYKYDHNNHDLDDNHYNNSRCSYSHYDDYNHDFDYNHDIDDNHYNKSICNRHHLRPKTLQPTVS